MFQILIFPDPDRNHRIDQKSGSGYMKKKNIFDFIFSTLNTVLFGQVPPKPNTKHHLDPTSLLIDGSGSAKKPGSIRIRIQNTVFKRKFGVILVNE